MNGKGLTPDAFEVRQNSTLQFLDVLRNDSSVGAQIASVSYGSEGGTIRITEDRSALLYAPPADFFGTETFVYYTSDQLSATVIITVKSPLFFDEFQVFPTDKVKILDVLANDPFWAGYDGPRKITSVSETLLGNKVKIADDGKTLLFTTSTFDYGKDSFVYIVDGLYPAQVKIDISSPLKDDSFNALVQNTGNNVLNVLANDPFWVGYPGAGRITKIGKAPSSGTVAIAEGGKSLIYTPSPDYIGGDSFTYLVDGIYEATVSLQVNRPVQDDQFEIDQNTADYPLLLIPNDTFYYYQDGMWFNRDIIDRITSVGQTSKGGTIKITADGQGVIYSAPAGFVGIDTFEYLADGKHHAMVTVKVTSPVRDDCVYNMVYEDTFGHVIDVLGNDFKGNGYSGPKLITAVSVTSAGASVTIAPDGRSLIYTPATGFRGTDTFHYTVDGAMQAAVQVYVGAITEGDYFALYPDLFAKDNGTLDVLGNDHFWQHYSGPGIITAVSQGANGGIVTISGDGKYLYFTPMAGKADSFTYTVDGKYQATVSVSFYSCLKSDSFVVDQNGLNTTLTPLNNDFLAWNGAGWWESHEYSGQRKITAASTENGTVTIAPDGKTIVYSPATDYSGEARIIYTVDGIMQETITVQVIRRVRDDVYHVERGSRENILPVLVNDLFGADYKGAGRVTAVSATEAGGTVSVSADGASIRYTPPTGFKGSDSFVYTVDGKMKAKAVIYVESSPSDMLSQFGSRQALIQSLLDEALKKYENLFGQIEQGYPFYYGDALLTFNNFSLNAVSCASRIFSDTNVQVAGVDEGDIVENDGSYLYVLNGGKLIICRAWPAQEMEIVSQRSILGKPIAEYLHGDRLTVISQIPKYSGMDYRFATLSLAIEKSLLNDSTVKPDNPFHLPDNAETIVTVFDVSNRASPKIVEVTALDGRYIESRRIDDKVFLVMRNDRIDLQLPGPKSTLISNPSNENATGAHILNGDLDSMVDVYADSFLYTNSYTGSYTSSYTSPYARTSTYVYESREQYIERMKLEIDGIIDSAMPNFSSFGPDGELLRQGAFYQPEEITHIGSKDASGLLSIVSMDISDNKPGITASTGIITSGASEIYGTLDHLYLFDQVSTPEDGLSLQIIQFDWSVKTGKIHLAAKGVVPGQMSDQFAADEFNGNLRIATTLSNSSSGNWSNRSENVLFVLHNDGGVLETIGGMQNLALDESIRSVRFLGSRAFITTFNGIDPLFALDLSDPAHPLSCGHVTMPGFNSYMQLIDENHILSVGRNSPDGISGPTQITLYDIHDLARPRIIDSYTFEQFSTSLAENDHHAFGWFAEHQTLAIPTARTYWQRVDADGDGYYEGRSSVTENRLLLFKIDVAATRPPCDGIRLIGEVEHDSTVRRGAFIDNVLYSISDSSIRAVDIVDPTIEIATVKIDVPPPPYVPTIDPCRDLDPIVPTPVPEVPQDPPFVNLPDLVPIEPTPERHQPRAESQVPWAIIFGANTPSGRAELNGRLSATAKLAHWGFDEESPENRLDISANRHAETPKVAIRAANDAALIEDVEKLSGDNPTNVFDRIAASLDFNLLHEVLLPIDESPLDKEVVEFLFSY